MAEWSDLMTRPATPEELDSLLTQATGELASLLGNDPNVPQATLDLLGRRLSGIPVDSDTWGPLQDGLTNLLGPNPASLLSWVAQDPNNRLSLVEQHATSDKATTLVRRSMALYGPEFNAAVATWAQLPNDWQNISWKVDLDLTTQRPHMTIKLRQYSGVETVYEGDANSFLVLVTYLLRGLLGVGTGEAFDPQAVDQFVTEVSAIQQMLQPPKAPHPSKADAQVAVKAQARSSA